jgi:DNA-binding response OmpR family regulator
MAMRVAVLDDDATQLELVRQTVHSIGHDAHGFSDGAAFLRALRRERFELLVFDWQLPDIGAIELLRAARANLGARVPVLVIADPGIAAERIEALAAEADDFMLAPVRCAELSARLRSLLRRVGPSAAPSELVFGPFRVDVTGRRIERNGLPVALKHKEFDLALYLFRHLGQLLSRRQLLQAVWGVDGEVASRSLDTHASRLRTKLGLAPQSGFRLASIYGVGYRLERFGAAAMPNGTVASTASL